MMLEVDNLAVARGGLPVLEGVQLALAPGEALVLRGPNGAGKTTLLRTIAGLQPPLEGRMTAAPLAYAAHADGLKAALSAEENLRFWARIFGTGAAEVQAALAAFELAPLAGRLAGALSAGQKRRLGLARLLVTGRPLWVLDEPTVSLDASAVAQFAGVVRAHLAAGGAALMATHIDLGLDARSQDITPWRVGPERRHAASADEAFL